MSTILQPKFSTVREKKIFDEKKRKSSRNILNEKPKSELGEKTSEIFYSGINTIIFLELFIVSYICHYHFSTVTTFSVSNGHKFFDQMTSYNYFNRLQLKMRFVDVDKLRKSNRVLPTYKAAYNKRSIETPLPLVSKTVTLLESPFPFSYLLFLATFKDSEYTW